MAVRVLVALIADLQSIVERSGQSSDELRQRISDETTAAVQVVNVTTQADESPAPVPAADGEPEANGEGTPEAEATDKPVKKTRTKKPAD